MLQRTPGSDKLCVTRPHRVVWLGRGTPRRSSSYNSGAWKETSCLDHTNHGSFLESTSNWRNLLRANHSPVVEKQIIGRSGETAAQTIPGVFPQSLHLAVHVLSTNFNFLSLTKMEFRDSIEIVTSSVENTEQEAAFPCHSHFLKHSTHLGREWQGGSRCQCVCAQTTVTLPARKFHLLPVEGLLVEPELGDLLSPDMLLEEELGRLSLQTLKL